MGYATPKMLARYHKATPAHGASSHPPKTAKFQGIMDSRWAPKQTGSATGPVVAKGPFKGIADSMWAPKGAVFVPDSKVSQFYFYFPACFCLFPVCKICVDSPKHIFARVVCFCVII